MTVQHADIFHCLKCGRMRYEPHGTPAPVCCSQTMVRAVADVVTDVERTDPAGKPGAGEHALLAESEEISGWCRSLQDVDASHYVQLAQKLRGLHVALIDYFDDEERTLAAEASTGSPVQTSLRGDEHQQILSSLATFSEDLRQGDSLFRGWSEVCERLDSLVSDFRQHEAAEEVRAPRQPPQGRSARGH